MFDRAERCERVCVRYSEQSSSPLMSIFSNGFLFLDLCRLQMLIEIFRYIHEDYLSKLFSFELSLKFILSGDVAVRGVATGR